MRLKDGRLYKDEQAEEGDTSLSLYNVNSSTDEMLTGRGPPSTLETQYMYLFIEKKPNIWVFLT